MSDFEKPYVKENASQYLMDIVDKYEGAITQPPSLSEGELKRIELMRYMKSDTDKVEYILMLQFLMGILLLLGVWYMVTTQNYLAILPIVLGIGYTAFVKSRLRDYAYRLQEFKHNFDQYLHEGYSLKEMRYNAVKLGYLVFFPFIAFFLLVNFLHGDYFVPWWVSLLIALVVSTIGWLWFFKDDSDRLRSLESDINSLQYLK
ncbi:MAG: hypothetical protein R2774_13550 [Saprospiraceae bacterium]